MERLRRRLRPSGLAVPGPDDFDGRFDPAKLVILTAPTGRSGLDLERELAAEGITLEMADRDTLVPIGEAVQFADVLRRAGRPVELVEVPGAEHAFDAVSSITSRTTAAVIRDWLRRTVG